MAYFDGIKIGDNIWSSEYGDVEVREVNENFIIVKYFDNDMNICRSYYDLEGYRLHPHTLKRQTKNQTLFWDKIKFEIPKKPKIKLKECKYLIDPMNYNMVVEIEDEIELLNYDSAIENGFNRDDRETAKKALKQIKRYTRLLALRDQECPDSRGFEFTPKEKNYCLLRKEETGEYDYCCNREWSYLGVYFKTEEDAQRVCDILNSGKFDLEGE